MDSGSLFMFFTIAAGIGDFWIFVSISHTINGRFPHLVKWLTSTRQSIHNTDPTDIRIRLNQKIRIWILNHRITFGSNFGVGGGLRSLSALVKSVLSLLTLLISCQEMLSSVFFTDSQPFNEMFIFHSNSLCCVSKLQYIAVRKENVTNRRNILRRVESALSHNYWLKFSFKFGQFVSPSATLERD